MAKMTTNAGMTLERRQHLFIACCGGTDKKNTYKLAWRFLKEIEIDLSYDQDLPLWPYNPRIPNPNTKILYNP